MTNQVKHGRAERNLPSPVGVALVALGALVATGTTAGVTEAEEFASNFPTQTERVWVGPEYWANRLQDWRLARGRLECVVSGPDRNVHLLTRTLGKQEGNLRMSVRLGCLDSHRSGFRESWVGFRIGAKGRFGERHNQEVIPATGMNAGITTTGELFIGNVGKGESPGADAIPLENLELRLLAEPAGESYKLSLTAHDAKTGERLGNTSHTVPGGNLYGNLALVCHSAPGTQGKKGNVRFWFAEWRVSGSKINVHDDQTFGPILFAQYTLSRGVLKMTAQMPPMGESDSKSVRLQIREQNSDAWNTIGEAGIDKLSRTATFRIERWDDSRDTPYRLAYALIQSGGKPKDCYWGGTIRRNPVNKETIVVAAFTGNNDLGWPNADIVKHVKAHNPDVLVFTGDQIYERVAGYGVQRRPLENSCLDYLRKWYLWGWAFGDLCRDRPCVCLPDDHDVYHGNLWGAGGRAARGEGMEGQDSGGYKMPPEWVRMVERTQTSHLPDPYDPTPVEQGIGVYYCAMDYGGVSFAIIEDRKFKSSPTVMVPEGKVVNGWFQNPDFDPATRADVPGAKLLGDRQLTFLREWSADWSRGAWMKVVLSQTIFANVATLPKPADTDAVVPRLIIPDAGSYPEGDVRVADADSNGWPQTARNNALREMRRGFAFHIAGDQHLGSTIQYGIEDWHDAGFALCVPAVANVWPRRWFPPTPGLNRRPGSPGYTGDYRDGFGNYMTVHAVSNPAVSGREPTALHDRATGYGIVKFDRNQRRITIECWPRYADPTDPSTGGQYSDWPITIKQTDNYARKPAAFLPTVHVHGLTDPVVQVIDQANDEVVYTLRIRGTSFRPQVFKGGLYTVIVSEPDTGQTKKLQNLTAAGEESETIDVTF